MNFAQGRSLRRGCVRTAKSTYISVVEIDLKLLVAQRATRFCDLVAQKYFPVARILYQETMPIQCTSISECAEVLAVSACAKLKAKCKLLLPGQI